MELMDLLLISLFLEAIVNAIKPLWTPDGGGLSVSELVSMALGMLLAVTCQINMLAYFVTLNTPVWVEYVFYALTGIALGRGPSFLHDLWYKIKELGSAPENTPLEAGIDVVDENGMSFKNWTMAQLMDFCARHGIDTTKCVNRVDYMSAIEFFCLAADGKRVDGEEKTNTAAADAHTGHDAYLMRDSGNPPIGGAE